MAGWPANPVAAMRVDNFRGGTDSWIRIDEATPHQQTVAVAAIVFTINIQYHDHPLFDHGRGFFSARLDKLTPAGWQQVDAQSKTLGDDTHDGDWHDSLSLSVTMTDPTEDYEIVLHCETQATSVGTSADITGYWQAVQGQAFVGDFTLDFIPVSIIYCPPGQDMNASLAQSSTYGTKLTLGESAGMQAQIGIQAKIDILGIFSEGVGYSSSQSVSNQNTTGIQISHFRNTVVTADNQRAIGRAYWGPPGDIFVILVNPTFSASRRADGTILYWMNSVAQVLFVPAWKLLRPGTDPIASAVPPDVRRKLLELDPFIQNLNQFFPDSGADLSTAANPFADPSAGNRAELIGRWWLDSGTELNYSIGETHQLFSGQATEVKYSSTVTINASAANFQDISLGLGLDANNTTWVGFQSSLETDAGWSKTAACFLIHNQNERDLDAIEVYYDKQFSTFMFRRIRAVAAPGAVMGSGVASIAGSLQTADGLVLRNFPVTLTAANGTSVATITRHDGTYAFYNLEPGPYTLRAGAQSSPAVVTAEHTPMRPLHVPPLVTKRMIDLRSSAMWEVTETLGVSSEIARSVAVAAATDRVNNEASLAQTAGIDTKTLREWKRRANFRFETLKATGGRGTGGPSDKGRGRRRSGARRRQPPTA